MVARANPVVKIVLFKHNENKLYHIYNLNTLPSLANPDSLDANSEQSYLELPSEARLSQDALFMTINTFGGEVKVVRLPAIINPARDSDEAANPVPVAVTAPAGKGQAPPAQAAAL